jgi:uncharacterized phiE125 gp8 family phage protein
MPNGPTSPNFPFPTLYQSASGRRFRSLAVIVQPAVEPVTLAEARLHCAVDHEEFDPMLQSLIQAAREYAERFCRRHFIDTKLQMTLDNFPLEVELPLPRGPVSPTSSRQTVEVEYYDTNLSLHSMTEAQPNRVSNSTEFLVNRIAIPPVITPNIIGYWPVVGALRNAVVVRWWSGFGDSPNAVPRAVRHSILLMVGNWFLNREAAAPTALTKIPYGVNEMLTMFRIGGYS